jgi:hypothetical protein
VAASASDPEHAASAAGEQTLAHVEDCSQEIWLQTLMGGIGAAT